MVSLFLVRKLICGICLRQVEPLDAGICRGSAVRHPDALPDEVERLHRPIVSAQVGEWLKPTDCKSVPPSEVRRFESFPVHQNLLQQNLLHQVLLLSRLSIALVCYVVLGVLTWTTITDPKFRTGTLVVLALFAVKSVLRRKDVLHPDESTDAE